MKIYVTKYALTRGILVFDGERVDGHPGMVTCRRSKAMNGCDYFHGNDWHTTEEEARDQAQRIRVNKLASLRKQQCRIEELVFNLTKVV